MAISQTYVHKLHSTCNVRTYVHMYVHMILCSENNNDIGAYYTGNGSNVYYLNNFDSISQSFGKSTVITKYVAHLEA